ncbi:response regulator receiver modulated CheW protein [Desulfovibrio sp. X2]|uniref:chemotaxis protein n=1 Tax=Desulfovibrio sp. X2 TaxID=941449 RepID=UPI0003588442|nr:chemotaxis protein [Desulfovibrio sp. X2]EPR42209.1 response regulator receiver modulated CheW protein [Desulfovibrio sp. X2]
MSQTNILLESGTNELEIVEFFIDEVGSDGKVYTGHYGVNVAKVLEIIRKPQVTAMPNQPHPCVKGAFNLRSRIIPLVDLSLWLGKRMQESEAQKVVVTEFNNVINAFLVSGVNRIHRLSWTQIEPPDDNLVRYTGSSITGVVKFDDRIILILDMEKIIADLNPNLTFRLDKSEEAEEGRVAARPVRVLISDDSSMIRRTLSRGLEKVGFEVVQTSNGKDAWDRLEAFKHQAEQEQRPLTDLLNIVVSDIEMPIMDGHNLCKRIKDDPVLGTLPVILFSSLITDRLRHKGLAVGADDQISKPDITILARHIKKLLNERQGFDFAPENGAQGE